MGDGPYSYTTIQKAIDAINAASPVPSSANRCAIIIHSGTYTMTATLSIPAWVSVQGINKNSVRLINATTDMFTTAGDNVWWQDFLVEGSATTNAAFNMNNHIGLHVRNVDMLNNGGANTQRFIYQSGATWTTMFVEHCVIDSYKSSDYVFYLANTSGAARYVDVEINDVFCDSFHLTNYGGGFILRACQDVRFKDSKIRGGNNAGGSSSYQTGVRIELNGATGTAWMEVFTTYFNGIHGTTGQVAIYGSTRTVSNSAIT